VNWRALLVGLLGTAILLYLLIRSGGFMHGD
jgi:hypothetical protein